MSDNDKDLEEIYKNVVGHISQAEARQLFNFAKDLKAPGAIVEIGSYQGKSTIFLAKGSGAGLNNKIYAIDPHAEFVGIFGGKFGPQDRVAFLSNIEKFGVAGIVELISKTSEDAAKEWRGPISLLWIDGDHAYDSVLRDFSLWEPHLVPGGLIAFHDCSAGSPPTEIFNKKVALSESFSGAAMFETIGYATKK